VVFSFREEQQQNPEITYDLNFKANSNGDSNNSNSTQVSENDALNKNNIHQVNKNPEKKIQFNRHKKR
jgi:hypothetical protein